MDWIVKTCFRSRLVSYLSFSFVYILKRFCFHQCITQTKCPTFTKIGEKPIQRNHTSKRCANDKTPVTSISSNSLYNNKLLAEYRHAQQKQVVVGLRFLQRTLLQLQTLHDNSSAAGFCNFHRLWNYSTFAHNWCLYVFASKVSHKNMLLNLLKTSPKQYKACFNSARFPRSPILPAPSCSLTRTWNLQTEQNVASPLLLYVKPGKRSEVSRAQLSLTASDIMMSHQFSRVTTRRRKARFDMSVLSRSTHSIEWCDFHFLCCDVLTRNALFGNLNKSPKHRCFLEDSGVNQKWNTREKITGNEIIHLCFTLPEFVSFGGWWVKRMSPAPSRCWFLQRFCRKHL